jgi:predicted nuclease of restriction endonuclease-like (RecB) superfamily
MALNKEYKSWLQSLKQRIQSAQIKAALKVNVELIELYWNLGYEISEKGKDSQWGDKLIPQLSKDLLAEFPDMKGFSQTNLKYIRRWYQFYRDQIGQQLVDQLAADQTNERIGQQPVAEIPALFTTVPWGHHLQIITKSKNIDEALFYISQTAEHGWSRNVLMHQIESSLYKRKGVAVTNFHTTLPKHQSDLAKELLKDPYKFDFLSLGEEYLERDLENALIEHITKFLLELGAGFSYVGRQYHLEVGGEDFYIDLLFYHLKLRCFVVIELKAGKFIPEYASKLNFYLNVVDDKLRHDADGPSIGILICKERNKVVAEYALRGMAKPIGISEYELTEKIPGPLKGKLPTIKEIEAELNDIRKPKSTGT